ncbi:hypothetical protein [Sphingopyxis panaciterrulae]|uniref:Uncharacterized protein n=2 Tax=Sphingopyxis TaxID=165697 RepID=A0A7W9B8T1_9SPHN|nr:hypothetical protein [Sphingopyxis panaciterrulae]MBB5708369.1 hypothetical protein [Sphingopyxis panaciterrulae]SBV32642.1 membrane protein of unknown function [uncultured Sphingopyxis sp.]
MSQDPGSGRDEALVYQQRCEDFRSLNGFLWQSPLLIMTLSGGLWFAVASFELTDQGRSYLLNFAGLANLLMIGALIRLRWVMQRVLGDIRKYDGKTVTGSNFIIVGIFSTLLLLAAGGSFMAARTPSDYFCKVPEGAVTKTACPI